MSSVAFLDPAKDSRWDVFVESHPDGLICHLAGWKEVLEQSFAHIKGYFPVILDPSNGAIRAGLPLYLVRSPLMGSRLVSIPFATLSAPLATFEGQVRELLSAAIDLAARCSACRIEIRSVEAISLAEEPRYERVNFYKHHYIPLDEPAERLLQRFHRTSVRQVVKRSEKNGLELYTGCRHEDLQGFFQLYVKTRKRLGLPPQPFRLFENLWRVFAPSGRFRLYQAVYQGKSIGHLVVFAFKDRLSAEFIAVDQQFAHLYPSHFLYWEAIKDSCEQGLKIFDFGRTSPNNAGLMAFKHRWGTVVDELPQFCYPRSSKGCALVPRAEESLQYRTVRYLVRKSPEILLPYLGEICYRHMG